jgi:hypothetical protein
MGLTLHLCVLYSSGKNLQILPDILSNDRFLNWSGECLLRGAPWVFYIRHNAFRLSRVNFIWRPFDNDAITLDTFILNHSCLMPYQDLAHLTVCHPAVYVTTFHPSVVREPTGGCECNNGYGEGVGWPLPCYYSPLQKSTRLLIYQLVIVIGSIMNKDEKLICESMQ